jgi:hypothetical protein
MTERTIQLPNASTAHSLGQSAAGATQDRAAATPRETVIRVDVREAVGLDQPLETVATVVLPDVLPADPTICFAWPGGGYHRGYYTLDLPGGPDGAQASYHTDRGWIVVACDYLNAGDSTRASDPYQLTFEHLVAADRATVDEVLGRLRSGNLVEGLGPVDPGTVLGIGQSLGGGLVTLQQGQRGTFDAVALLGWSARHTVLWLPPGSPRERQTYLPRGIDVRFLALDGLTGAVPENVPAAEGELARSAAGFHFDDVDPDVIAVDMIDYPARRGQLPEWATDWFPPCAMTLMSPGVVAAEAAVIDVPVFVGLGERDVCPDPLSEPQGYPQSADVTVFVCPSMAHMHNFAGTRARMWARLQSWGDGVAAMRA